MGSSKPLPSQPSVEEVQTGFWLIHWNHVARGEHLHKGEVAASLEFSILVAVELQVLDTGLVERLLSRPFQSFGPSLVAEPVAARNYVSM